MSIAAATYREEEEESEIFAVGDGSLLAPPLSVQAGEATAALEGKREEASLRCGKRRRRRRRRRRSNIHELDGFESMEVPELLCFSFEKKRHIIYIRSIWNSSQLINLFSPAENGFNKYTLQ